MGLIERHKSTGDMLMGCGFSISPDGYELEELAIERKLEGLKIGGSKKRDCCDFREEEEEENNNSASQQANKWSSCKFLGAGKQKEGGDFRELDFCKSTGDFSTSQSAFENSKVQLEPISKATGRRRKVKLKANGARRHPSRVARRSLSQSSPLLCRQDLLSMDSGRPEACQESQTKPAGRDGDGAKAGLIVVEMGQLFEAQQTDSATFEQPESFKSALSNCCAADDNGACCKLEAEAGRGGGKFCNSTAEPGLEQSSQSSGQSEAGLQEVSIGQEVGQVAKSQLANSNFSQFPATSKSELAPKVRMVEFSLLDSCNNWRRQALPASSGFYKVARERETATFQNVPAASSRVISLEKSCNGQFQSRQEVVLNSNSANQVCQASGESAAARRVSRLGRSPISLQRQTNARLARHRQKIQQQRQEQLAQLARRSPPHHNNSTHPNQQQVFSNQNLSPRSQRGLEALCRVNGLLERLPEQKTARQLLAQNRPAGPLPAFEICDNQRACSSIQAAPLRQTAIALNMSQEQPANYNQQDLITRDQDLVLNSKDEDSKTICSTEAGSTYSLNRPFCKICHVGTSKPGDKLISPCRCSGTMQYIHCGCLLKWLKISNKSNEKPISCELCAHEYTWHKRFNYKHIRSPRLSLKDLLLHIIFLLALAVMLFSALTPMLTTSNKSSPTSSSSSNQPVPSSRTGDQLSGTSGYRLASAAIASGSGGHYHGATKLAGDEKIMLICAASFFVAFFLAIYVQTKTRDTLYGFIVKFVNMNQTFYITEYDHGQFASATSNNNNGSAINNSAATGRAGNQNNNASGSSRCQVQQQQYGKS